jgi:hypothetical protein
MSTFFNMGDEISAGIVVERGKQTQVDLYDVIEKIEELKFQEKEDESEISFSVKLSDGVQAVREKKNELKGYTPSLYLSNVAV